ncbi:hypothetical protein Asulf_02012 [Archaeoglobus sulfaticallidus PM70-1]|uniref:Metal-binding protein n=1 Tax=Archaeoglobus sulfaticallidus PM70-1 TaxID=387631 RepID=N0BI62_9EURY|nr:DUF2103 domain-containing protein [Archaeoglobus sulfaticallidus]AGK61977.1 hypothetical protein Asulf_02012 [Archaeoglobus sulfaticallidus PM70-1]
MGSSKLGGDHTTIIGGRRGRKIVAKISTSEKVKRIVPGIIKVGMSSGGGFRAKFLRPDERGNLRLLLREGSTVQEIFIVTTAKNFKEGSDIIKELERIIGDFK